MLAVGDRVRYTKRFAEYLKRYVPDCESVRGTVVSLEGNRQNDLVLVRWDEFPDSTSLLSVTNLEVDSQDSENRKEES